MPNKWPEEDQKTLRKEAITEPEVEADATSNVHFP